MLKIMSQNFEDYIVDVMEQCEVAELGPHHFSMHALDRANLEKLYHIIKQVPHLPLAREGFILGPC
jgi:hypothetical protein